jgi:lipopolysaccharide transport system permease protein
MSVSLDKTKQVNAATVPVTIIRPPKGWIPINLRELWAYRELLYFLTLRDLKVRYRQTVIGFAWAVIQPLFMMIVFSLFFGTLAKVPSEGIPYPLFSYAAVLPWTLFSSSMTQSSSSLIKDSNLLQKVYFPRLLMPLAATLSALADFVIAFIILLGLMFYFGYAPGIRMLALPVFIGLELILALGVGLWLSALSVKYRDIPYVVPFIVQLGLFVSPVVYSSNLLPQRFQAIYGLNPMAGVIEGFRWSLLVTERPGNLFFASAGIALLIFVSGAFYFRRREKAFADVV